MDDTEAKVSASAGDPVSSVTLAAAIAIPAVLPLIWSAAAPRRPGALRCAREVGHLEKHGSPPTRVIPPSRGLESIEMREVNDRACNLHGEIKNAEDGSAKVDNVMAESAMPRFDSAAIALNPHF